MKIIKRLRNTWGSLRALVGGTPRLRTPDRQILEEIILPYFNTLPHIKNILFVGCEWYTKNYAIYFTDKNYSTLDYDPKKIKYGAQFHVYDNIKHIKKYFSKNSLDLIICNGVIGWGLNDKQEAETTFSAFYDCLTQGGIVMIGWNDVPQHRLFLPEETNLFEKFSPYTFSPFNHWRYKTDSQNAHTYDFYCKKN